MEEPLLRQRRNLLGISFALLLYIVGGGSINTLFGVQLAREWVPIVFAWIGFGYFWRRYWIFGGSTAFSKFEIECCNLIPRNKKIVSYLHKYLQKNDPEVVSQDEVIDQVINIECGNLSLYSVSIRLREYTVGKNHDRSFEVGREIYRSMVRRNWLYAAWHGPIFSDFMLPHFFSALVLLVGVAHFVPWLWLHLKPVLSQ